MRRYKFAKIKKVSYGWHENFISFFKVLLRNFLIFISLLFLAIQTTFVQEKILDSIVRHVTDDPNQKVILTNTNGCFPYNISFSTITINNQKGAWLVLNDMRCKLLLKNLLMGKGFSIQIMINNMDIKNHPVADLPAKKENFNFSDITPEFFFKPIKLITDTFNCIEIKNIKTFNPLIREGQISAINNGDEINIKLKTNSDVLQINSQGKIKIAKETLNLTFDSQAKGSMITDYGIASQGITGEITCQLNLTNLNASAKIKQLDFNKTIANNAAVHAEIKIDSSKILNFYLYCEVLKNNLFEAKGLVLSNLLNCNLNIQLRDIKALGAYFNNNAKGQLFGEIKIVDWDLSKKFAGNFDCNVEGKAIESPYFIAEKVLLNSKFKNGLGSFEGIIKKGKILNKDINGEVIGTIDQKEQVVNCKSLAIIFDKNSIKLNKPAYISLKSGVPLIELKLNNDGMIVLENLIINPWRGKVSIKSLPLSLLQLFWDDMTFKGNLNGVINLYGQEIYPSLQGTITGKNLSVIMAYDNYEMIKSLNTKLEFDWGVDKLLWKLNIIDPEYLNLTAHAEIKNTNIDGHVKGDMKLKLIGNLLHSNDRIYGDLETDLKITGLFKSPQLQGAIKLRNGFYENADSGTIFKNITLNARAQGNHIEIYQILGQDNQHYNNSNSGWVKGDGKIDLSTLDKPKIEIKLRLNDTQIADSGAFNGTASGELSLYGPINDLKIQGDVKLFPSELFLEEVSDRKIPRLKIVNKEKKIKKKKQRSKAVPMDITVKVPSKFFIRGFGVDSQWQGDIKIVDSILNPQLLGKITIAKGTIDFLGKSLQITQGTIIYDDLYVNEPLLDIIASKEATTKEILYLKITGRGNDPKIEFASSPALPQEEVFAMILFGKRLSQISAMQSIQLFSAITSLKGHNGLNFLEKIRSTFGLDSVEFKDSNKLHTYDNDGQNEQALSLGKEFGKVRVALEQGTGSSSSKITVSTTITKINDIGIDVQADVGGDRNSGVGLGCQKRY